MFTSSLFAYFDPGSGSMLLQVILGGSAAVAVAVKLWWRQVLAAIGILKSDSSEPRDVSGTRHVS
jgi:hypothetical protein